MIDYLPDLDGSVNSSVNGYTNIIGCGGISNGNDVYEYILAGADAVQIGTTLLKNSPKCFEIITSELIQIMSKKKYKNISEYRGKLMYLKI